MLRKVHKIRGQYDGKYFWEYIANNGHHHNYACKTQAEKIIPKSLFCEKCGDVLTKHDLAANGGNDGKNMCGMCGMVESFRTSIVEILKDNGVENKDLVNEVVEAFLTWR